MIKKVFLYITALLLPFVVLSQNNTPYNKSYLRSLEKIEEENIINKYVNIGLQNIENMMITYAINGYTEISIIDCNEQIITQNNNNIYNDLTQKDYNYLRPIIIKQIELRINEELCNDCVLQKNKVNNCIKYTLLW